MISVLIKKNPAFQEISAVIVSENNNVNKFALITSVMIERDFKSEYLSRTCSVRDVNWNSFRFVLLCCAVSSQLWNIPVLTHFHSDGSAATSSVTKKYGTVPERPSRNKEQDGINVSTRGVVKPDVHFNMKP